MTDHPQTRSERAAGFSLVELAVVLTLLGLLTAYGLKAVTTYMESEFLSITRQRLDTIQEALVLYAARNRRLPCPSDASLNENGGNAVQVQLGVSQPTGQTADCTAGGEYTGVPWRELGLPRELANDAWRRRITYRVFDGPTGLTREGGLDMSACVSSAIDDGVSALTDCTGADDSPLEFLRGKGLMVKARTPDADADALISPAFPERGGGAAFALISHGADGGCARLRSGALESISGGGNCAPQANQRENNDNDDLVIDREIYQGDVNANTLGFDDILRTPTIHWVATKANLGPS